MLSRAPAGVDDILMINEEDVGWHDSPDSEEENTLSEAKVQGCWHGSMVESLPPKNEAVNSILSIVNH